MTLGLILIWLAGVTWWLWRLRQQVVVLSIYKLEKSLFKDRRDIDDLWAVASKEQQRIEQSSNEAQALLEEMEAES